MYRNDRMEVYDNKLEEYRPLKYSDIAVVMRSMTHGAEMVEIFRQHYNTGIGRHKYGISRNNGGYDSLELLKAY